MEITKWFKVNKAGEVSGNSKAEPGPGLYIGSIRVPFTDDQGTLEYFALDGTVMLPRFCLNGQQRDAARREALRYASPAPSVHIGSTVVFDKDATGEVIEVRGAWCAIRPHDGSIEITRPIASLKSP